MNGKGRFILNIFSIAVLSIFTACAGNQDEKTAVYVSTLGDDSWSGRLPEPKAGTTDGPFATLARAREAVREMKRNSTLPEVSITVFIRGGQYHFTETFTLTGEDSGTPEAFINWRSFPGEEVVFTGGKNLDGFAPVENPGLLKRLSPAARESVLATDLKALGITDYGDINPRSGNRMELYFRGMFMTQARYPNEGWLTIADVPQSGELVFEGVVPHKRDGIYVGRHYGRFTYEGDRPAGWSLEDNDIWMHGYWTWDWSDSFQKAARIDIKKREIYPAPPHHSYGYHRGQRFYFVNVLEELDMPGEWCIDSRNGVLYFWPPDRIRDGDVLVSLMKDPLVTFEKTDFIVMRGIQFTGSRGSAVRMSGSGNTLILGCIFKNFGQYAIVVEGGRRNGIVSCDISEVASGGIRLDGGDRKTLTPGENWAVNNHIHHYAKLIKTYQSGIHVSGVGNRIANNCIHDAPHMAIGWSGNEHIIELNEVYDVLTETNDAGACYNGRDPSQQGTIIRYNYWHHIGRVSGHGTNAVYFDDALCGNTVFGNIFYKAGLPGRAQMGAVFIHGGRYNVIDNNIFIECEQAYGESPWDDARWAEMSVVHGWHKLLYETVDISSSPYSDRYPWMANIMDDKRLNVLSRNLVFKCGRFLGRGTQELIDNLETDRDPGFMDAAHENFRLRDDSWVYDTIPGFQTIPFERIGLYADEYRSVP